jgi:ABC-2 type transport system ATP-binding protein
MSAKSFAIKSQNLVKDFGKVRALDNLSINVTRGCIFGYLGPNGSGKTTTVRILSGLLTPSSGTAEVCGLDISKNRNEIKAKTGLLPETPGVYNKLSAVEFLQFVGALYKVEEQILESRISKLLSILGLEGRQDDIMESYSSGMKQKVLVASTLIHDPELVFLDEPTSRLDPSASVLVRDIIISLAEETDTTFFICSHMLDFVERTCDTIGILNAGRMLVHGSVDDVTVATRTHDLEEAYLKIIGGEITRKQILDWRK